MTPLTITVFAQAVTGFPAPDAASRFLMPHRVASRKELTSFAAVIVDIPKERSMANNKNANEKQPGEKEPGKFHYNPGNMSGKTIGTNESQQRANADTKQSRREHKDQKR